MPAKANATLDAGATYPIADVKVGLAVINAVVKSVFADRALVAAFVNASGNFILPRLCL